MQIIAALLAAGAEVDAQTADGRTPLHRGAASGSEGALAALAAAGANLNARTRDGLTPLRIAALRHGDGVVVRALLAGGATPDADALDLAMQVSRAGNVVGLTRREEEHGAYCAALPEANLAAGTAVTLVGPELALSGVIDRSIESFPGELVEDLAMRLTNADHRGSFADCERLQLALFDLDSTSAKYYYYRVTTNVADVDTYSDLLAFIGRFDTQRTAEGHVAVEITDSNPNARVRVCNTRGERASGPLGRHAIDQRTVVAPILLSGLRSRRVVRRRRLHGNRIDRLGWVLPRFGRGNFPIYETRNSTAEVFPILRTENPGLKVDRCR